VAHQSSSDLLVGCNISVIRRSCGLLSIISWLDYYLTRVVAVKYCNERVFMSAYLCDCLPVCPLTHLKIHTSELHKIFCTCCLWPWLVLPLTTVEYVMYFRFLCTTSCFHITGHKVHNGTACGIDCLHVQYGGEVWCLQLPCWVLLTKVS